MRALVICLLACVSVVGGESLRLDYEGGAWLVIRGEGLPEAGVRVHYLEAYCRAGSTEADWVEHTVIPHRTEVLSGAVGVTELRLRDVLEDGLVVEHVIRSGADEVDFRVRAHNPTGRRSEAHWAQPCVRLGEFMGYAASGGDLEDYLPGCFIFLDGREVRLSDVRPWAEGARYEPGQVWCPAGVPRGDVNPRPLSDLVPSNGLIGAYSGDGERIFATAWEPYQELFQGVIRCLHSDFRLGGVGPGEVREVRGKIYLVKNDMPALLERYARDFPEQVRGGAGRLDVSIREGSEAGGLNVRSISFPGELLDFRTCEGVVVGSEDLGLFQVKLPMGFGDGWKSWRREGEVWSYEWPYDRGVVVRVEVEVGRESLKLRYRLTNNGERVLDRVQLHTCVPTTEAPAYFPEVRGEGDSRNWSELYERLHVWSGGEEFRFADVGLAGRELHLSLMLAGEEPVDWAWWVNGEETFDVPLVALTDRGGRGVVALGFERAIWASANVGDERACFHLFPWFGRVEPGASVEVEGRLYWMEGGVGDVLARFRSDFPECFNGVK